MDNDEPSAVSSLSNYLTDGINLFACIENYLKKEIKSQTFDALKIIINRQLDLVFIASDFLRTAVENITIIDFSIFQKDYEETFQILLKIEEFILKDLCYENSIFNSLASKLVSLNATLNLSIKKLDSSKSSALVFKASSDIRYDSLPEVVTNFLYTGKLLKDHSAMNDIKSALEDLKFTGVSIPSAYVALIGPSYMGKTQCACTLAQLGKTVIYVNFSGVLENESNAKLQPIYEPFKAISDLIHNCLTEDISTFRASNFSASDVFKSKLPLYTLGILRFLLVKRFEMKSDDIVSAWFLDYINLTSIKICPISRQDFKSQIECNLFLMKRLYTYSYFYSTWDRG